MRINTLSPSQITNKNYQPYVSITLDWEEFEKIVEELEDMRTTSLSHDPYVTSDLMDNFIDKLREVYDSH